jgi:hypothetical protein
VLLLVRSRAHTECASWGGERKGHIALTRFVLSRAHRERASDAEDERGSFFILMAIGHSGI